MELEEIINSENSKVEKEKLNLFIEKRKKIYRFLNNFEGKKITPIFFLHQKKWEVISEQLTGWKGVLKN